MIQIDIPMPEGCMTCPFHWNGDSTTYCLAQRSDGLHVIDNGGRGSWESRTWKEATCPLTVPKVRLRFKGVDSWDRPVYQDRNGNLWKDVHPQADMPPKLCSACNNEFDGEPDCPFHGDPDFVPGRAVWAIKRNAERWEFIEEE